MDSAIPISLVPFSANERYRPVESSPFYAVVLRHAPALRLSG